MSLPLAEKLSTSILRAHLGDRYALRVTRQELTVKLPVVSACLNHVGVFIVFHMVTQYLREPSNKICWKIHKAENLHLEKMLSVLHRTTLCYSNFSRNCCVLSALKRRIPLAFDFCAVDATNPRL